MLLVGAVGCATETTETRSTDSSDFALVADQCAYVPVNGKVQICHATPSSRHPYQILNVTADACVRHALHEDDYIAIDDPSCSGGGCLPADAPCDATLPCCDGSSCNAGTCTVDALATPTSVSSVSSMITDTGGGIYFNWIGAWFDVNDGVAGERFGYLLPWDEPNTPTVEDQFYFSEMSSSSPSILAIGPSNGGDVPEQILTVTTDTGTLSVYMPAIHPDDCVRTRFYVAADGSTYHSRADHDYTYSPAKANIFTETCFGQGVVGPDLTPGQALVPQHLARSAP